MRPRNRTNEERIERSIRERVRGRLLSVRELVAVDLPGGEAFVEALRRIWDAGDAALPVDLRLDHQHRRAVAEAAGAHAVIANERGERMALDPGAPLVDSDDALVLPTSGSTGEAKLVVHTFESLSAHAWAVHRRLAVDPDRDRWLACLPLVHLGGLGVVVRAIVTDTPLDVLPGFDTDDVAAAPRRLGSTLVSLVPTALDRIDPTPFRWIVVGGAADPVDRPGNVVRTYGLTEAGGGVVYDGVALDGTEVAIGPQGDHGSGLVSLRGLTISRGLRNTDGSVHPLVDGDGWLATGDLGHFDAAENLVVDGRADDLIITGGENVWPEQVEAALRTHPGIETVTVVGRPDQDWGHRVVAVVVPANPAWPPSLDELRRHVADQLPPSHAPRELVILSELPRTALGKVRRPDLENFHVDG